MMRVLLIILLILLLIIAFRLSRTLVLSGGGAIEFDNKLVFSRDKLVNLMQEIEAGITRFEPITTPEEKQLRKLAKKWKLPYMCLVGLRDMIATQRSMDYNKQSYKSIQLVKRTFEGLPDHSNTSIKRLFEIELPPLEIVRILRRVDKQVPDSFLAYADSHDSETKDHYTDVLKRSVAFEENLNEWFRSKGFKFRTEKDLIAEQMNKFGRAVSTPDLLFDEPVLFRVRSQGRTTEQLVRWVDAKNYTLVDIPFIRTKVTTQAEKYCRDFGPGAFVFHYGFINSLNIPNTLLLDASFIRDGSS